MELRKALEQTFGDWRDDLDDRWRPVLAGVEPDFAGVPADLDLADGEAIFPGRRGRPPAGARADAHVFRALEGIAPDDVSVVVVGQDPYTKVAQATGRSFEQGDLSDWLGKPRVSPSLSRMIQALAAWRTGETTYTDGAGGWGRLVDAIRAGNVKVEPPRPLWDRWQEQGVLFINAILTFNRYEPRHQFKGHGRLWAPVVRQVFAHLVRRKDRPIAFVTWGDKAQTAFANAGVRAEAEAAGTWGKSVAQVVRAHPNAMGAGPPFLRGENPWAQINDALAGVGGAKVDW